LPDGYGGRQQSVLASIEGAPAIPHREVPRGNR
jgi:hypothetical protein